MAVRGDEFENASGAQKSPHGRAASAVPRTSAQNQSVLLKLWRGVQRFLSVTIFSSLTRRIIFLNLTALAALVAGIFYLNSWREGLIDTRAQSLRIQGQIISAAIAASATIDSDVISVNPDRLLELLPGGGTPLSFFDPTLEFPISPERVAPLLRELVTPTHTRARIYDKDGLMIIDSANIYTQGQVLPATTAPQEDEVFFLTDWWNRAMTWVPGSQYSLYQEYASDEGKRYPEVNVALTGAPADIVRVDKQGQLVVSVAVPVQRSRAVVGALLLSTQPGDIDTIVVAERLGVLRIGLVAALVTTILSILLAGTIAGPMRRLSAAAEGVQHAANKKVEIPDYTDRADEIGDLSGALRSMTQSLFNRIEAIERFAADVAHELKNPLTSLRSAVETLPKVKRKQDRDRLTAIIQHDVRRLDRLISDISNASRLDAELARESAETVDIAQLATAMIAMHVDADPATQRHISISLLDQTDKFSPLVLGHDSRLAQVLSNLIDNAVTFSPDGGAVTISVFADVSEVILTVADQGPGIQGNPERIFERFYTDRPDAEAFGDHSGLGLSISRQIIEAHKGQITAANRTDRAGAIFTVKLPRPQIKV